jgi:2-isopropylmalate synthase
MKSLEIFDTTLRDGAQAEGVSFSVSDKLAILTALDEFGVAYIEAGNPGSNPKDMQFFEEARKLYLKNAKLVAFGSTARIGTHPGADANILSLIGANTESVAIFGKSWDLHVTEVLKASLEDNIACIFDTVRYAKEHGKEVIYDAEHFYDGFVNNQAYALQAIDAARRGGADVLCLCDTNGGMAPLRIYEITKAVVQMYPDVRIGIHCHNDIGCAVANSLLAVDAGAVHVQGTFNGIGERCGNADLSAIIPSLMLKRGYSCVSGPMDSLRDTAFKIAEITNISLPNSKPYVGESAFAHKGGMHIDGVDKLSRSFEHVDPESVGNNRRFLLSEVSGRKAVLLKIADVAPDLSKDSPLIADILTQLKELEHVGFQFEAADASFALMVQRTLGRFTPHFNLSMYKTSGEFPPPDGELSASAIIKIEVEGRTETTAAIGNGPVNALDLALRKALCVFYPALLDVYLVDFKVRVLDTGSATGSRVRVLIESTDGSNRWTTVGASTDIIEASFMALVDSLEYKLWMEEQPWA